MSEILDPSSDLETSACSPSPGIRYPIVIPECQLCSECGPDIILESSDGIQFGASVKNLYWCSEAFPAPEAVQKEETEVAVLAESAEVLKLMLQYMHRMPQPDLWKVEDKVTLFGFAEAAEKYMIYPAMQIVKHRMSSLLSQYPIDVFIYAFKHLHMDLLKVSAEEVVDLDYKTLPAILRDNPRALFAWCLYREELRSVRKSFQDYISRALNMVPSQIHKGGISHCEEWHRLLNICKRRIQGCALSELKALPDFAKTCFEDYYCVYSGCQGRQLEVHNHFQGVFDEANSFEACMRLI